MNGTHTVNLYTNSNAGSGTGCMHVQNEDGSLAVHPVTSENVPGVPELQQKQTVCVLIDAGAVLSSSGNSLVGLVDSDSNFAVAEQVSVPDGTVTFRVR